MYRLKLSDITQLLLDFVLFKLYKKGKMINFAD